MNKDIKYSGYSAVPSDYECPDGELVQSYNLISENGAQQAIMPPKEIMQLDKGSEIVFIHKTSTFEHYIVRTSNGYIQWIDTTKKVINALRSEGYESFSHINAVGNTLLIFNENAIIYYLWKDGAYKLLGDSLPDIEISFGLVGHPRLFSKADDSKSTFTISFDSIKEDDIYGTFSDDNKTKITSQIMAKVNKFIANETVNKGRFCFPFFVRYALRLYDGTLTNHSAPILMNPSTVNCPVVIWEHIKGKKSSYTSAELDIMMVAATLDYSVWHNDDFYDLEDWEDIVKSVDVFISKPLYTYDQSGECTSFSDSDNFETSFIGRLYSTNSTGASEVTDDNLVGSFTSYDFLNKYAEWKYSQIYAMYFSKTRSYPDKTIHLPEFTDSKNSESIRNNSVFYKLCTLDISEVKENTSTRKEIIVEDEYLQSLVTREVMTDDYLSHDKLRASHSFAYNSRLNLSGVKRKLFSGFLFNSMLSYVNALFNWQYASGGTELNISQPVFDYGEFQVVVYIKENGKTYAVTSSIFDMYSNTRMADMFSAELITTNAVTGTTSTGLSKTSWGTFFFYPNANAFKMVVRNTSKADSNLHNPTLVFDLQAHDYLNGAYAMFDYNRVVEDNWTSDSVPTYNPYEDGYTTDVGVVDVPNKVYTSEINNPFYFPVTGINTVGTGKILGICSAAKALSQGQFGQFPLYAFTDEGVWAMEVSSTGTYSAKQPITRDVCINSKSITQIDSAVLFATDRGIMLISGSQTQCLTDILNAPDVFDINNLPGLSKLYPQGVPYIDCTFAEFLSSSLMSYDYVNQRIVLFNPQKEYAYVYSMKSKLWGIMKSQLISAINSYPDALAMATDGEKNILVDIGRTDADSAECLLVTRPLKLDSPDILKTMDTIIQRGHFQKGHVQSLLYGSRDLYNWHLLWTSKDHYLRGFRGTPYKYFRIALLCNLSQDESIFGASLQFSPRQINQPR